MYITISCIHVCLRVWPGLAGPGRVMEKKTQDETRAPYAHLVFQGDHQAQYTKQYGFYRRNFDYSKNITRCGTTAVAVNTIREYACEYSLALCELWVSYSVFCLPALFSLAKFA